MPEASKASIILKSLPSSAHNVRMILDDVYAELKTNHNVPLQELDGVTLQTILELLQQARAERAENEEKRIASEEKEARLRETIRRLSSVNAAQTMKLLASLDSLDVLEHRAGQHDDGAREKAALLALNQSLAARLRDANAEIARLEAHGRSTSFSVSFANDRPAIARARKRSSLQPTPLHPRPTQDNGEDSDTPTEVQHTAPRRQSLGPQSDNLELRTRTIVFELTRELEASRIRCEQAEHEKSDGLELLEAHLANRDKELQRAHTQLDDLYLAGIQPLSHTSRPPVDGDLQDILACLTQQADDLRQDIRALSAEKHRLAGGLDPAADAASSDSSIAAGLEDDIADRASAKLVEQREQLQRAREEINSLQEALQETEKVARDATEALEKEQSRRQLAESALLERSPDVERLRVRSSSQPDLSTQHKAGDIFNG